MEKEKESKGKVTVTFNYRYNPFHRKIKELILEGKIGRVTSVELSWLIDTYHGASYFKGGTARGNSLADYPFINRRIILIWSIGGSIKSRSKYLPMGR